MYAQVCPSFYINSILIIEYSLLDIRTPLIRTLAIRIVNYLDWPAPLGQFVENYTKLTCLEITGYRIKYRAVIGLLDLRTRRG